ncbi:type II toxin-antitoxin system HipA family toxin [Pandoraea norimbergensis]|uniref:Toxin HipA n=2 Tax=Pseudomonadota TaxID=1224 RepID=A0ABM5WN53_9BURK|nr:type II toxin-antitoxin system HipA family toxin [Pandoraea norimbergensis]ALS61915.1 toxin HipA [Pandoraea norimbergensis]
MGRRSHSRALSIWANNQRVGTWRMSSQDRMALQYDDAWRESAAGRPLSLSLPFGIDSTPLTGDRVRHYFDNLLPDSDVIRRRLAGRYGAQSTDGFNLLEAIGRDCVGAIQLLGEDESPGSVQSIEASALSDEEIAERLRDASGGAMPGHPSHDDLRLSIAGAQEKTALLHHNGRWCLPHGATPTTHILKLPLGLVGNRRADLSTSVENEWLCMQLCAELGLPTASCEMLTFGDQKVLSVTRFDRQLHASGTWIMRLPQEDFCQVFGLPPHLKYEADGGPGIADLAATLRQSQTSGEDLETVFRAQIVFWMLAATDGHAKNFSIHLLPGGRYRLTPLYDVLSMWPIMGDGPNQVPWQRAKLAMAVAGKRRHYRLREIQRRHFDEMATKCYLGASASPIVDALLAKVPQAIAGVAGRLPRGFPEAVAEGIFKGMQHSADHLAACASP